MENTLVFHVTVLLKVHNISSISYVISFEFIRQCSVLVIINTRHSLLAMLKAVLIQVSKVKNSQWVGVVSQALSLNLFIYSTLHKLLLLTSIGMLFITLPLKLPLVRTLM